MSEQQPTGKYWQNVEGSGPDAYFVSWQYLDEITGHARWMYTNWEGAAECFDKAIEVTGDARYSDDTPITREEAYMALLEVQARQVLGGGQP